MTIHGRTQLLVALLALLDLSQAGTDDNYRVGTGISDITGPAGDVQLWGYATFVQPAKGIHIRQYSRAVILEKDGVRVALVTTDMGSMSEILKTKVIDKLKEKYDNTYTMDNVVLAATHTHSAPGGFHQYLLYTIPSEGFIKQTFEAALQGIVESIDLAHQNMQPGHLFINTGTLMDSNINRSPSAYANNPKEEIARYPYNVDKTMTVLKVTDANMKPLGAITWFPVHPTSMNNTNQLISSDNKGYASMQLEKAFNGQSSFPGSGPFVAAFPNSNHADTSPNTKGPKCIDTGLPCDYTTSTCNGKSTYCIAFGPGNDMFESTKIIGDNQSKKSLELFNTATEEITGPIKTIHQHLDMTKVIVSNTKGEEETTCDTALGYSFAAGTTDGPGVGFFSQGDKKGTPFWNLVRSFIKNPSERIKKCQSPKPILLATGEIRIPYTWQPKIVPTQVVQIGQLFLAPVPAEFTTMSGRRLAKVVKESHDKVSPSENVHVVVQSLSNEYSSYLATFEEYQIQRYEGASTVYGPHSLEAYMNQYRFLTDNLMRDKKVPGGPEPPNLLSKQITLQTGVIYDTAGLGVSFGQVTKDVGSKYKMGETASVTFASGHPRNNLMRKSTFLTVEKYNDTNKSWNVVATDANWETKFKWERTNTLLGVSRATIEWTIPEDAQPGTYRIRHFGHSKSILQKISAYTGTSTSFKVLTRG